MKYFCFIPVVNRFDLLEKAVQSVIGQFNEIIIIDNSKGGLEEVRHKYHDLRIVETGHQGLIPAFNWAHHHALDNGYDFYIYMHGDGEAHSDMPHRFIEFIERVSLEDPNWGMIFSQGDVISAYSTKMAKVIGEWSDDQWPNKNELGGYYMDDDYHRRIKLAGFKSHNSGLGEYVSHYGSSTIKSDQNISVVIRRNKQLTKTHMERKWGYFDYGKKLFTIPYGTEDEREKFFEIYLKPLIPRKSEGWGIHQDSSGDYCLSIDFGELSQPLSHRKKLPNADYASVSCSQSAAIIWDLCDGKQNAYAITEQLINQFSIDKYQAAMDVLQCVNDLRTVKVLKF